MGVGCARCTARKASGRDGQRRPCGHARRGPPSAAAAGGVAAAPPAIAAAAAALRVCVLGRLPALPGRLLGLVVRKLLVGVDGLLVVVTAGIGASRMVFGPEGWRKRETEHGGW